MKINYQVTSDRSEKDSKRLGNALYQYNVERLEGDYLTTPLLISAFDGDDFVAGLEGWLKFDWLYIDKLWVKETCRGRGIGRNLILQAEQFAKDNTIYRSQLQTGSFQQGLDFYQKMGYAILAEWPIRHNNIDHKVYLLSKYFVSIDVKNKNVYSS